MSDMGDMFREMREHKREQIQAGRRLSNRYRTEKDRNRSIESSTAYNQASDMRTLKNLKALKIEARCVSTASFQLFLPIGKVMFYTGKNGDFIYVPQTKQRIDVGYEKDAIVKAILFIKEF